MDKSNSPGIEIFGAPGVGKSTYIRKNGFMSSQDAYYAELDRRIRREFKKKVLIPLPQRFIGLYRGSFQNRYDNEAMRVFESKHREFFELCLYVIFNTPVSAERRIRCYKLLSTAILSWWIVQNREDMIWDESFAKAVLYICGMEPGFAARYFSQLVSIIPGRNKYIFLDGSPQQGVAGQIKRGKYNDVLSWEEMDNYLRSAVKYMKVAERLYVELLRNGYTVEKHTSAIVV